MKRIRTLKSEIASIGTLDNFKNSDDWTCGEPKIVTLELADSCRGEACHRRFMVSLPPLACQLLEDSNQNKNGIILPVMFSIHCLGCSLTTFEYMSEMASAQNFVWINPEGLERSFHAGNACCGYALENDIDDLGFFRQILQEMSQQFSFVSSQHAYAMGWSNGGYMASYAASLFQAIVPVSGYQVENADEDAPTSTAIWLHHATDDPFVRPTGCCSDPTMPQCCCHLSNIYDTCTSVEQQMQVWAQRNDCNFLEPPAETYFSELQITCFEYSNCQATTKYCLHSNNVGHFNRRGFHKMFPWSQEIVDFFAQHMCEATDSGGVWNGTTCLCPKGGAVGVGPYCTPAQPSRHPSLPSSQSNKDFTSDTTPFHALTLSTVLLLIAISAVFMIRYRRRRGRRLTSTTQTYDPIPRSEMEMSTTTKV